MIRQDGTFELGTPRGDLPHSQTLWVLIGILMSVFCAANLWVHLLYPSDRVFHNLVLGGPYSQGTDIWRPFTAFLFEPNLPGLLAAGLALILIVRELEGTKGSNWLLALWGIVLAGTIGGYLIGDIGLLGRRNVVVVGATAPLVVCCLAYAMHRRDTDSYPFIFLQVKSRNLALFIASLLLVAFNFRTMPYWSGPYWSGHHWSGGQEGVVVSAVAPVTGIVVGFLALLLEPFIARRVALRRAMAEVKRVQRQAAEDERIDSILAKVGSNGIDSLSKGEMRFLRRTSRGLEGSRRRGLGQLVGAIRPRAGGPGSPLSQRGGTERGRAERGAASRRGTGGGPPHGDETLDPPIEPEELLQPGDPLEGLLDDPPRDSLAPDDAGGRDGSAGYDEAGYGDAGYGDAGLDGDWRDGESAGEPVNWDEMFEREGWFDVDEGPVDESALEGGTGDGASTGGEAGEGEEGEGPTEDDDADPSRPDASAH